MAKQGYFVRYSLSVVALILLCVGCCFSHPPRNVAHAGNAYESNLFFDEWGRIHSTVMINGTEYDAIFDTGFSGIMLDSVIFRDIVCNDSLRRGKLHQAFTNNKADISISSQNIDILFCGREIHFREFFLNDIKKSLGADLVFSLPIPSEQALHIDFQRQRLSLNDSLPSGIAATHPVQSAIKYKRGDIIVSFPFLIVNDNKDSVSCHIEGSIDTGSGRHMIAYGGLFTVGSLELVSFLDGFGRWEKSNSSDQMLVFPQHAPYHDITSIDIKADSDLATLVFGTALLAHYDIWLDLKNRFMYARVNEAYLPPIQHFLETQHKNMCISSTEKGVFVEYCSRFSPLWHAGLRRGDLMIGVDGKYTTTITGNDLLGFDQEKQVHEVYVLRDKDTLTLFVKPTDDMPNTGPK